MGKYSCGLFEKNPNRSSSFAELRYTFGSKNLNARTSFIEPFKESNIQGTAKFKPIQSTPDLTASSTTDNKKTNIIQLHKPIYIARHSDNVQGEVAYSEGDEFELLNTIDEDYLRVLHLRTDTECTLHRTRLRLDLDTPLRLGNADRGVIQRCLLQYNKAGAYLIRRSKNEPNVFILSISQISNQRNAEDWHYLIRINSSTYRFYFPQESRLENVSFSSFQHLVHDRKIREVIPLTVVIPFEIEFEVDLWNIPRRQLAFEYRIGKGEFGEVWRVMWKHGDRSIPVAVKKSHQLRNSAVSTNILTREIETLKALRNNFIVTLWGVAQDLQTNQTLIVIELMDSGDLKNWLKSCRHVPDEKTIASYAYDVCRGMLFLEQNSRVHRDLACRNLLLHIGGKTSTVKISDFGLSALINKDDFAQRTEAYLQKLPIRWTAPELLENRRDYSIKSDVWSFGIVLIEIWLKGGDPYPEEKEFSAIRKLVRGGYVHKKPFECSNQFYNRLILPCLCFGPDQRPSFKLLAERLRQWNSEKAEYERLNNTYAKFPV